MVGLLLCGYGRWNLGGESNWSGAEEAECMDVLVCGDGGEMWLGM